MKPRSNRHLQSGLAVAIVAGLWLSPAHAATSGTVELSGTVESTLSVTVAATASAALLDLSDGQKIVQVGDVSTSTNNEQGLTLTITSGSLTKTGGTSIAYQVTTVSDGGAAPAAADFTVASGTDYTTSTGAAGTTDRDLYIMYSPAALQDPGTYSGTITLTVSDNA